MPPATEQISQAKDTGPTAVVGSRFSKIVRSLLATPPRCAQEELLDQAGHDPAELAANFRDIRLVNRLFGGTASVIHHLPTLLAAAPLDRPVTVLDLATGSGDIPLAIARWAERSGRAVAITASDASDEVLAIAARHLAAHPEIALVRYDAREVPLPDGCIDVVLCSLALHHFQPADAIRVLREMDRLACVGFIVNDLARSRLGYLGAWLASHVGTRNRLTRHDAPLSALRAYTPAELKTLLDDAEVAETAVFRHRWFRMTAVKVKNDKSRRLTQAKIDHLPSVVRGVGADFEAIVVGGGPAGSTTAMLLAEAGHRVLLLDKAVFPRHKACAEYINPAAVQILRELGLVEAILTIGPHCMEAMAVHAPGGARFLVDFGGVEPGQIALGLSRLRLDHLLLQRAEAAGVTVRQHTQVRDLLRHADSVIGVNATVGGTSDSIRAPLVIGADGRHSTVTRRLALETPLRWPRRTGLMAHYRGVTGLDRWGELHVATHGYAGLAPLEDGLTNVAFVAGADAVATRQGAVEEFFATSLGRIPAVEEKLAGSERVGAIRGIGPLAHRVKRVAGDGYLLVGDAAGFLDPFTGDGIYHALRGAQLAAPIASAALRAGDLSAGALAPYQAARRRAFAAKRQVCLIVQIFVHSPTLMDYATARLDRREELGETFAGVLGDLYPARQVLSPLFLARLLRP